VRVEEQRIVGRYDAREAQADVECRDRRER
jgi:hypothetical protein